MGRGCKAVPSLEPSLDTMGWERAIEGCDRGQNRDFQVLFCKLLPVRILYKEIVLIY